MTSLAKDIADLLEFVDKQEIVDDIQNAVVRHRFVEKIRLLAAKAQKHLNENPNER